MATDGAGRVSTPEPGKVAEGYEDTGGFVKGLVAGLTALVNAIMGAGSGPDLQLASSREGMAVEPVTPAMLLEGLRGDFVDREYLWSGNITDRLYDEDCVFTDPTLSFRGLAQFKRNLANLDPILNRLVPPGQRRVELRSIELNEPGSCVVARWRMVGDLAVPWRPRLDLGGETRFTYDPSRSGQIVRYDEKWEISASDALWQLVTPAGGAD